MNTALSSAKVFVIFLMSENSSVSFLSLFFGSSGEVVNSS